jgi:hypothetical protein
MRSATGTIVAYMKQIYIDLLLFVVEFFPVNCDYRWIWQRPLGYPDFSRSICLGHSQWALFSAFFIS